MNNLSMRSPQTANELLAPETPSMDGWGADGNTAAPYKMDAGGNLNDYMRPRGVGTMRDMTPSQRQMVMDPTTVDMRDIVRGLGGQDTPFLNGTKTGKFGGQDMVLQPGQATHLSRDQLRAAGLLPQLAPPMVPQMEQRRDVWAPAGDVVPMHPGYQPAVDPAAVLAGQMRTLTQQAPPNSIQAPEMQNYLRNQFVRNQQMQQSMQAPPMGIPQQGPAPMTWGRKLASAAREVANVIAAPEVRTQRLNQQAIQQAAMRQAQMNNFEMQMKLRGMQDAEAQQAYERMAAADPFNPSNQTKYIDQMTGWNKQYNDNNMNNRKADQEDRSLDLKQQDQTSRAALGQGQLQALIDKNNNDFAIAQGQLRNAYRNGQISADRAQAELQNMQHQWSFKDTELKQSAARDAANAGNQRFKIESESQTASAKQNEQDSLAAEEMVQNSKTGKATPKYPGLYKKAHPEEFQAQAATSNPLGDWWNGATAAVGRMMPAQAAVPPSQQPAQRKPLTQDVVNGLVAQFGSNPDAIRKAAQSLGYEAR